MSQEEKEMLETLLVVQVLTLAQAKKNESKLNGQQTTSDFINDACRDVVNKRERILQKLLEERQQN